MTKWKKLLAFVSLVIYWKHFIFLDSRKLPLGKNSILSTTSAKCPCCKRLWKKSQAFEEFFSSPGTLLFCFECRRQRNNTARPLQCPLNLQSQSSPAALLPQGAEGGAVTSANTNHTGFLLWNSLPQNSFTSNITTMKSDLDFAVVFKTRLSFAPQSFCKQPWSYRCIEWSILPAVKSQRLLKGVLCILYFSSVSSYHDLFQVIIFMALYYIDCRDEW